MKINKPCEYQALFVFTLLCFLVLGIVTAVAFDQRDKWREKYENTPVYHCDGSREYGFADPGTPEAAGCWYEIGK